MFIRITDKFSEIRLKDIRPEFLTVGFVTSAELEKVAARFGFDTETVEACRTVNPLFRSDVDVYSDYTFTELRIINREGEDDFISIYVMKNFLLVVDVQDRDSSTKNSFIRALKKYPGSKLCIEKIICCFIDALLSDGNKISEAMRGDITDLEEDIVRGTAGKDMNISLLGIKKRILRYQNFYGQILDITETLGENGNDIFREENLIFISNLENKVSRLCEDMKALGNSVDHLQDAYYALLDQRMNNSMKIFTIITTIFFPLTIIVGWYGMNFQSMPEFAWKYGYIYVILLSVAVVRALVFLGRRKKWF